MKNRSLISITDYSKEEYLKILDLSERFEKQPVQNIADGKVVATLFF
jgi:aspartate carbamoyltransferase catalytic subunit